MRFVSVPLGQRSLQSRETIQAILSFAPDTAYRLFDINLRQHYYDKVLIEESLYLANVLKMNEEEMLQLKDLFGLKGSGEEVATWFMKNYNLKMVVLTAELLIVPCIRQRKVLRCQPRKWKWSIRLVQETRSRPP